MIAYIALYIVAAIAGATSVILIRAGEKTSRSFALATLAAALWALLNGIYQHLPSASSLLLPVANLSYVATILIGTALALFSQNFIGKESKGITITPTFLLVGLIVVGMLCLLPGVVIRDIDEKKSIITNPWVFVFAGYFAFTLGVFFVRLVLAFRRSFGIKRQQVLLILAGSALSTLFGLFFNLILPLTGNYGFVWSGPLFLLIFIFFTVYAIVTTQLFDIRLVIKRTFVFSALVSIIVLGYAIIGYITTSLLNLEPNTNEQLAVNIALTMVIAASIRPFRRWLSVKTDSIFFKQDYDERMVVHDLGVQLNAVIGLDEALEIVMQTLIRTLHLRHTVTYVFPQAGHEADQPVRILPVGYAQPQHLPLGEADGVRAYFQLNPLITSVREITQIGGGRSGAVLESVQAKLQSIEAATVVPLQIEMQSIGLLCLYESDQAKNEFVSVASHELITPISAIEGYIDYVLQPQEGKTPLEARTKEYLDNVKSAVHRLSSQLKDLLDVSRIESGKMTMEYRSVDVGFIVRDTVNQLRFVAQEKGIEVKVEVPADIPEVWADSDRTVQVIVNLLSNAIKYNREKGSVLITGSLRKGDGMIEISVKDTGFGMKAEQMTHLFEKFYRVDSSKTVGIVGTGLGLYITKSIVERMGGQITVKSEEGSGTTFTVTLPSTKRAQATGLIPTSV